MEYCFRQPLWLLQANTIAELDYGSYENGCIYFFRESLSLKHIFLFLYQWVKLLTILSQT